MKGLRAGSPAALTPFAPMALGIGFRRYDGVNRVAYQPATIIPVPDAGGPSRREGIPSNRPGAVCRQLTGVSRGRSAKYAAMLSITRFHIFRRVSSVADP